MNQKAHMAFEVVI